MMWIVRAVLALVFLLGVLVGSCVHAAEVEAFVGGVHGSDITRGAPFNDKPENTFDALHGGMTITAGKNERWEIDIAQGVKRFDGGRRENATTFGVRFYPGRKR